MMVLILYASSSPSKSHLNGGTYKLIQALHSGAVYFERGMVPRHTLLTITDILPVTKGENDKKFVPPTKFTPTTEVSVLTC